jgi:transposase-like protein
MHVNTHARRFKGTGGEGKVAVMGVLERGGEVRSFVVPNVRGKSLRPEIVKHVEDGAFVYTDALASYRRLGEQYEHEAIDHAVAYVRGKVHTNGLENLWSL